MNKLIKIFKSYLFQLRRKTEDIPTSVIIAVLTGVIIIALVENFIFTDNPDKIKDFSFGDSLWWAIVTLTTVGYGDYAPDSVSGRFLAVVLMGLGIVFTSVLSGAIASIFVERKLREGRGMKELKLKKHFVICGWNERAESVIHSLPHVSKTSDITVVLVNELTEDVITELKIRYKDINLKFVKGDFTKEEVLKRASVDQARSVTILTDRSGTHTEVDSDQRTIIAAFAIKNMTSDVSVAAELNNKENEEHLRRANVEDILIYGDFGGFMLSHAAVSPGVPSMLKELLSFTEGNTLHKIDIPSEFVNKTFKELFDYLNSKNILLIGILSEEKDITLDDILSDDSVSAIDQFIKKKFSEVEDEYFGNQKPHFNVKLNPGDNYVIQKIDSAFIISKTSAHLIV